MNRPAPKELTILNKHQITPNMIRITLQGQALDEGINWNPGCYVKLVIPPSYVPEGKTVMRTYTARSFDAAAQTMTIDFAIHQPAGPATSWALQAPLGSQIGLMGPGQLKIDPSRGDWYLFAADMAALPAALSVMESLPEDAKGYAFLEITDEQDQQSANIPTGIKVRWITHSDPKIKSDQQLKAIQEISMMEGIPNVFVAGELSTIREIKSYIQQKEDFGEAVRYISSYWKIGLKEEEHKLEKRRSR